MNQAIERNPKKLGGKPVIAGTRFFVAQLLAELADDQSVGEIAEDFDIECESLKAALHQLANEINNAEGEG